MTALQGSPEARAALSSAARTAFREFWHEDKVLADYGAALARAAHRKGDAGLARAFEAGAFENGAAA